MIATAFILGLLGSFHCIGMCGPIAFMLPVHRSNATQKLFQISLYHLGRLLAYGMIGFFFGLVGRSLHIFDIQQGISIAMGILMIAVVALPINPSRKYAFAAPIYKIIGKVKSGLGKVLQKKTPDTFLTIGFLNGFLPCGLVYMAIFGAIASTHVFESSLYMLMFGLGTVPLMTITVYAGNFTSEKLNRYIQKAIPIVIVTIGVLFILRGMGLGIPYLSPKPITEIVSANLECHR